jgi:hypothetical protein
MPPLEDKDKDKDKDKHKQKSEPKGSLFAFKLNAA